MTKICPSCGSECGANHSFCPHCGAYVPKPNVCPSCGHELMEDHVFCPHCGTPKESNEEESTSIPQPNVCASCGYELMEGHAFCPRCGTPKPKVGPSLSYCGHCGNELSSNSSFCPFCGNPATGKSQSTPYTAPPTTPSTPYSAPPITRSTPYATPYTPNSVSHCDTGVSYKARGQYNQYKPIPNEGMAWYKFIIYFQLFASAAICFINAILWLSTDEYEYISKYIDGFGTLRFFYLFSLIGLGIDALLVRSALAKFQQKGPKRYITFVLANAIISLIYVIWLNSLLDGYADNTFTIITIITNFVMAFISWVYFDKREHLFVN